MTEKQIKQRWIDIKKTIKSRPLLAYLVNIPIQKWNEYMCSTPVENEVNRIYEEIRTDRIVKTARVRNELSKIVGCREAKIYSKKIGISDTTIRDIIEEKKVAAGYEVIDKFEVFINAINPDFDLSIENPLNKEKLVKDEFESIVSDIRRIASWLAYDALELMDVARNMRVKPDWSGNVPQPSSALQLKIEQLTEIKEKVDVLYDTYIHNK